MMPRQDVQVLDMSVDAALKYIVSMGVVAPVTVKALEAGHEAASVVDAAHDIDQLDDAGGKH